MFSELLGERLPRVADIQFRP